MSTVAICSLVRDGLSYLPTFRRQIECLTVDGELCWNLYCVEGDSEDESWSFLQNWARENRRITVSQMHVGRSLSKDQIALNWASVANVCLDLIPPDSQHTHVLWVESDLYFPPEIIRRLLVHDVDIVAPMIYLGGQFYDTWGFRALDGKRWRNHAPYHDHYVANALLPMQSVGSCVLFARTILDSGIRMRASLEDGLLVGMCNDARAKGMTVWADTGTAILHPVDQWEQQIWILQEVMIDTDDGPVIISPEKFKRHGIERNLPRLDPNELVFGHRAFFRWVFAALNASNLLIEVLVSQKSDRRYLMRVAELITVDNDFEATGGSRINMNSLLCKSGNDDSVCAEKWQTSSEDPAKELCCQVVVYENVLL